MATGLDQYLTMRAKYGIIAITKYAIGKLRDGDKKCHDELMLVVDRIKNLVYALDSESLEYAIDDDGIYCLNASLFKLLQSYSYVPGVIPSGDTSQNGIGHMSIRNGVGNIFTIS